MLIWLVAAIAAAKLLVLAALGPSVQPDTELYVRFADAILDGTAFHPVPWGSDALPNLVFRLAGYPLILAAAKLLSSSYWAGIVVVAQGMLSLVAMALMFRVAARLLGNAGWAALAVLLYAGSSSLLWDDTLLSDSFYSSLFNIVLFALLGAFLGCWRMSPARLAGLAMLWGFGLWIRDSGLYFTYLPVVLLLMIGAARRDPLARRLGAILVFLLITAAWVGAYSLFNRYRTGEAFFSITGAANYLRPLFDMRHYGYADPFTGDDLVSQVVRDTGTGDDFFSQLGFLGVLHQRCACTPTELQSLVMAKFVASVVAHPLAYVHVVIRNFNYFGLASDLADPVGTINQFVQLGTSFGARVIPGLSLRHIAELARDFSLGTLALMLISGLSNAVAGILFTLLLFGVPFLWLRAWRRSGPVPIELQAVAFLWFAFFSLSLAFSLVHYEARHAMPVFPAAQIGIVYMAMLILRLRRRVEEQPV